MKKENDELKKKKKSGNWFLRNIIKLVIVFMVIAGLSFLGKMPKKETTLSAKFNAPS